VSVELPPIERPALIKMVAVKCAVILRRPRKRRALGWTPGRNQPSSRWSWRRHRRLKQMLGEEFLWTDSTRCHLLLVQRRCGRPGAWNDSKFSAVAGWLHGLTEHDRGCIRLTSPTAACSRWPNGRTAESPNLSKWRWPSALDAPPRLHVRVLSLRKSRSRLSASVVGRLLRVHRQSCSDGRSLTSPARKH
jgi:hypothetical protein